MTIDHIDVMLCTMAFFLIVGILIPVFWILRPGQLKTIDSDPKCNIAHTCVKFVQSSIQYGEANFAVARNMLLLKNPQFLLNHYETWLK